MTRLLTNHIATMTELREPHKVLERSGGQPVAILKNTLGRTIAANTVYTFVVNGTTHTHQEPRPLAANETLSRYVQYGAPQGPCSASVPGMRLPDLSGTFSTAPLLLSQ